MSAWLDELVRRKRLPQKLFLIHQFTAGMVDDAALMTPREVLPLRPPPDVVIYE